ncbi:MAG: hypothetical protein ACLFP7_03600 [Thiohalospira sp.]
MSEQEKDKTTPQGSTASGTGTKSGGSSAGKSAAGGRTGSRGRTGGASGRGGKRAATPRPAGLQGPAMGRARQGGEGDPFQSANWRPRGDAYGTGRRVWPD